MSRIPPPVTPNYQSAPQNDVITKLIPKNGFALAAYYCGVFAIIPLLGAVLGPTAVVLGIKGLMVARQRPESKGAVHAWVGIIAGGLFGLFWIAACVLAIVGIALEGSRPHY